MKKSDKIYHVCLHVAYKGRRDYYFYAKSSIVTVLGEDTVGIGREYLNNTSISENHHYANGKCIITVENVQ